MAVEQAKPPRAARRRRWRKWAVLSALVVLYFLLAGQDRQMKYAPHEGYYPEGADSLLYLPSLPMFWGAIQESHAGELIGDTLSDRFNDLELSVRLATGIRPTPARWQLWLGPQALLAHHNDAWGACFHPGLLMRGALWLHRYVAAVDGATGITRFGDFYYLRMENFLLIATDPNYLQATLAAPQIATTNIVALDSLAYQRAPEADSLRLELQANRDLFLRGYLRAEAFTGPRRPLADLALPETEVAPLMTLGSTDWEDCYILQETLSASLRAALPSGHAPDWAVLQAFLHPVTALGDAVAQGVASGVSGPAYAMLTAIDSSEVLPWPAAAYLMASAPSMGEETALNALEEALDAHSLTRISYLWGNYEGWQYPVWGEHLTLCLAEDAHFAYLSTQEPLMHALLGNTTQDRRLRGNMLLKLNWSALGRALQAHRHQQPALWPGNAGSGNPFESGSRIDSYLEVLEGLGALELVGESSDGMLSFHGYLARAEAS